MFRILHSSLPQLPIFILAPLRLSSTPKRKLRGCWHSLQAISTTGIKRGYFSFFSMDSHFSLKCSCINGQAVKTLTSKQSQWPTPSLLGKKSSATSSSSRILTERLQPWGTSYCIGSRTARIAAVRGSLRSLRSSTSIMSVANEIITTVPTQPLCPNKIKM